MKMAIAISRSHFNCSFWRSAFDLIAIAQRTVLTKNFKGGTSPRIDPWNQSKI